MKSIKTLESINLEDVPGFNNNNKHYKNLLHLNPSLTDLGVYDLGDTYLPKKDPYDNGQDVRTPISTTPITIGPRFYVQDRKVDIHFLQRATKAY